VFAHLDVILEQQPGKESKRHLSLTERVVVQVNGIKHLRRRDKDVDDSEVLLQKRMQRRRNHKSVYERVKEEKDEIA
jgi:hypothetical protein